MIHILAIAACIAGFACLCSAMTRHQKDFIGRKLSPTASSRVRISGAVLLLIALIIDMAGMGTGYGLVAWCGHLTIATALVLTRLNHVTARPSSKIKKGDR